MPVVDAKKLFVFLHQPFHFFLAVFKHGNPPVRCLDENSEAAAREAAAERRWRDSGGGAFKTGWNSERGMRRIAASAAT
jgi:hypothetical protein